MPYKLGLDKVLASAGWQVKIYDAEGLEPPHVTIFRRGRAWRVSLRTGEFMDVSDSWSQIDEEVRLAIEQAWETLIEEWDRIHPTNPVSSQDDEQNN